jgi:hypothetical protein
MDSTKSPKTTVAGIMQVVIVALSIFGYNIAPQFAEIIVQVGTGLFALISGYKGIVSKDK